MDFKDLVEKRYSCRKMSSRKVDDKLIDRIIEVARKAPTAVNKQPFRVFWMKSDYAKEIVGRVTRFTFGAETFLLLGYKEEDGWVRSFDQRNFADVDASIVATHMMMEIADLGLATTWVGYFDAPLLQSICPETKGYELVALFPIGYAAEGDEPSARHYIRKEKEEILETL